MFFSGSSGGGVSPAFGLEPRLLSRLECLRNRISSRNLEIERTRALSAAQGLSPETRLLSRSSIKNWLNSERQAPDVDAWVRSRLSLSDEERARALVELDQPGTNDAVRKLGKLVLYDEDLWKESYWEIALLAAQDSRGSHTILQELIERMPEGLKQKLLGDISKRYAIEQKSFPAPRESFWLRTGLGPKRGMDAFLKLALKPERALTEAIHSGQSPAHAYAGFLESQKRSVFPNSPIGSYGYAEIIKFCRKIQRAMKTEPKLWGSRESAIIGGSFVNGRANLNTSDIDIINPSSSLMSAIKKAEPKASGVPINAIAQGRLNPFQLRVQTGGIDLIVYGVDKQPVSFRLE